MRSRVIKENDLFLMTDEGGDIAAETGSVFGLFTRDTRFLSRLEIRINGLKPVLLSSSADESWRASIRLTNPHMEKSDGTLILWRESVEIERKRFIYDGVLYESITLTNYHPKAVSFEFSTLWDTDFADMFVVRGYEAPPGGQKTVLAPQPGKLVFRYIGSDRVVRETRIEWEGDQVADAEGSIRFLLSLQPREKQVLSFRIVPVVDGLEPAIHAEEEALSKLERSYAEWNGATASVQSDDPLFDRMYARGVQDLRVLLTDLGHGPFPVAGLPIFAVPFGRDSLIAALQMLAVQSEVAKGTLRTMASMQGTKIDPSRDEQPGKIMHEIRYGELANLGRIPFTPYYGTIDATPLFLILAAEYYHWTADRELMVELLPHIEQALHWLDHYGDSDGDGFVEYRREADGGLANQGWKDSGDSIVHEDGELARGSIALVEVQGYVYLAKTRLAPILAELGLTDKASKLSEEAELLRKRFEDAYWMEDERFYAIALDGDKKQVRSVTSNTGQALMSGIVSESRARAVAERMVSEDMFSGYGIRTMSKRSAGYNPMSYHDGSIWPHDNSLCILGLKKYGFNREAVQVVEGLMQAAAHYEYHRLPELFCGYDRSLGYPVSYPVACSPQAWAAGTPLLFLQVLLGLKADGVERTLLMDPVLPSTMNELRVRQLRVGEGSLSLNLRRETGSSAILVQVIENSTGYDIRLPYAVEQ
ncbi:amylo-alpha-1,6-glucosidase [Cohnella candidum]|uniref:Amylo-alpha-1,6-glucosidase n=1 Tax=Cohnella candidum TaxID=2674991 RepID=A0A3G3K692_9BACL|nr:amylo-alpha-1,6-glucosidase [Cohnella candidum]AYQ75681.1 amylo-alpha-1,6-glucosidase [Cohnella candidum]